MNDYIKDHLPEEMILGQLMEECAELSQAAHKIIRLQQGVNLPHGDHDFIAELNEELADVLLCAALLDCVDWDKVSGIMDEKCFRWGKRLMAERENQNE